MALALGHLGRSQSITGHIAIGLTNAQLGLQIARKCGDKETLAKCLFDIGTSFDHSQVISPEGEPYLRESVALWRQLGNKRLALAESIQSLAVAIRDNNGVEAESLAREALSLHHQFLGPDDPTIVIDLSLIGGILVASNRIPEADAVLNEAVLLSHKILEKDSPNQYLMLYALAQPLCRQGKWNEVETMVRKAVEAYPSSAGYWGLLGNVSASRGNWTAAADQFARAVDLAPNYSVVVSRLAIANLQAGRREQYRRLRHEYVMKDFDDEAFRSEHVLFEVIAFLMQPADGADFERLCRLGDSAASPDELPRNKYWKELLRAQTEFRRGDFKAASNLANRIASRKDSDQIRRPHAWFLLALACVRLNEMESAKAAFAKGEELVIRQNRDSHAVSLWSWPDPALAELLRNQAAELLGVTASQPTPDPKHTGSKSLNAKP